MMGTASQWEKTTKKHRQRLFADNQKHSHSLFAEERISQAKGASKSLKRHTDNGTCPETVKYRTKAKIRADNGFKKTSSESIKKRGTRNAQSDNTSPSPWKQPLQGTGQESKESQAGSHSTEHLRTAHRSNQHTQCWLKRVETGKEIPANLQAQIIQFGTMMEKLRAIENKEVKQFTCILWLPPRTWGQKSNFKNQPASN